MKVRFQLVGSGGVLGNLGDDVVVHDEGDDLVVCH